MISRSSTLASFSSSRQMMMAWKVSGLSHRPAIIASRPASIRLAMAISPSRDSSSTEPISRRYMRTGSSVRSAGSLVRVATAVGRGASTSSPPSALLFLGRLRFLGRGGALLGLLALDDADAHLAQHRVDVFDLVGGHLLGGQHRVQFVMRDEAAPLGELDHPLDGGIRQIEQRAVGRRARSRRPRPRLVVVLFRHSSAPPGRETPQGPALDPNVPCSCPDPGRSDHRARVASDKAVNSPLTMTSDAPRRLNVRRLRDRTMIRNPRPSPRFRRRLRARPACRSSRAKLLLGPVVGQSDFRRP